MIRLGGEQKTKCLAIFSILFIILVSGCIFPSQPQSGGVVIEAFTTDIQVPEIYSGEPISFQLKFRNTGSLTAENVFAELFGLDESWCCDMVGIPGEGPWLNNEKLPNEDECRYTGQGTSLLPPDPDAGTSGESQICTWSYKAPQIPENLPSVPYTVAARLFYTYKTTLVKSITFGSHQDLRTIQNIGGTLPASTTRSTRSPISITMQTKSPVRFWTASGGMGEAKFPIEIDITNVGGGMACASESGLLKSCKLLVGGEESKNKIILKITPGTGLELQDECSDFRNGKPIILWKGESNSIACDVKATGLEPKGPVQKMITVEAFYEYATDTEISIRLVGIE
ncbi:MAG: hypothetical protein JSW41_04690 [Candidatus Aenigmatarchaeota archaeon]|nr:MAG: hypothetical protein JSW41_04690 [Candidatus Aenigmarchaeota archaeon]